MNDNKCLKCWAALAQQGELKMEYLPQVKVSKEDFLVLSDLAGEMSVMDYMSKVIRDHVAAQQSVHPTTCTDCGGVDGRHYLDCLQMSD